MSTCKACAAPIEWFETEKGRRIPLDIERHPVDGNITITPEGIARVVAKGRGSRVSHYATCPNGNQFRKKSKR